MSKRRICDVCGTVICGNTRIKIREIFNFCNSKKTWARDVCGDCWHQLEKLAKERRKGE